MHDIERSNERGKFSVQELRAKVRESKAYWASPEGKAAAAIQEREKRSRKTSGVKFPTIANSTKPALAGMSAGEARTRHAKNILARVEKNTPPIEPKNIMNLKSLLGFPEAAKPPARIRTLRAMVLTTADGETHHADAGAEITVSHETLRMLDAADYDMLDSGRPPLPELTDPSPERQEPRPLPLRWNELPPCFAEYHNLTEAFRTAREHIIAIRETRIAIFGTDLRITEDTGTILMGRAMHANPTPREAGGVLSSLRPINTGDPKILKTCRFLASAEARAENHLARLKADKSIALQRAFLACGTHRLAVADELRVLLDELAAIGFDLFSVRTAALGLADFQVRRLFHGSADFLRFSNFAPAITGGTSSAGLDERGQMIPYSDSPVQSQASWALSMAERIAELKPLLAEGKRELAKARKATAAAA